MQENGSIRFVIWEDHSQCQDNVRPVRGANHICRVSDGCNVENRWKGAHSGFREAS